MGLLRAITALFTRPQAEETQSEQRSLTMPHWPASGSYSVNAVGESYCRDDIRKIAGNENGESAVVFCAAVLVPDDDNQHDPNAVGIWVQELRVGFLSREQAPIFRKILADAGLGTCPTTCDVVIYGGGVHQGKLYDYSVELDLPVAGSVQASWTEKPRFPRPIRVSPDPELVQITRDEMLIAVPHVQSLTLNMCQVGSNLDYWAKPDVGDIHLYTRGSIGGSGRVAVLPKRRFPNLERDLGRLSHLTVHSIEGSKVTIRLANSRDARLSHLDKDVAKIVVLNTDIDVNGMPRRVVAIECDVAIPIGTLIQAGDAQCSELEADNTGLKSIRALLSSETIVVAIDARRQRNALARLGISNDNIWVDASSLQRPDTASLTVSDTCAQTFSGLAAQLRVASDCKSLMTILFSHTGKTKRSRTHLGLLLSAFY